MLFDVFITIFLVFLNGFFVAAEFAIVKVRTSQIELRVKEGNRMALAAKGILKKLDAYLSATQLGITLASLGLGWIGESVVSKLIIQLFHLVGLDMDPELAHQIAFPVAFAIITVLHIVFGELAPKTIAIQKPESTTMALALPLQFFYNVFRPFIWLLNGFANAILRSIGIHPSGEHAVHSPQELLYIIEESKTGGALGSSEHQLLENALDFYDRPVKHIMVPRTQMLVVSAARTMDEVVAKVISEGFSRLPVYRDTIDNIVGIIHGKDLLAAVSKGNLEGDWQSIIRPVDVVPETKKLGNLLRDFQARHSQIAIIIDEFGGTAGLVTLEDILEELVGEIQDEYDEETPWVVKSSETEYVLRGNTSITDANECLPKPLPHNDNYDTLGGYMFELFGKVPTLNEEVKTTEYRFIILEKSKHHIRKVKAVLLSSAQKE
ncbi:MAG: hemolysin family protein [Bacteroidota bacterium]|nr:hemolysin family protein [Bacteroidota bacterium]